MDEEKHDGFVVNDDGSATIKLDYPIEWGESGKIETLTLQRIKGKQMRHVGGKISGGQVMDLAVRLCEYPPKFFDEMDGADLMKVTDAVSYFLGVGPETGDDLQS